MISAEFERAMSYALSALGYLKKGEIPPYPQFYELLYIYATGSNPDLNAKLNSILAEDKLPTLETAEELYREFVGKNNLSDRLDSVSNKMSLSIDSMNEALGSAMATADAYSGSLEDASGQFEHDMSPEELKALAQKLLVETRQMQDTNKSLESKLAESREDISSLQQDLDDMKRESMLDALTKVHNRKCFDDTIARELEIALQEGHPLSLVMVDIDHFKRFNDTFGHQTGDQVLRLVAMTLKANVKGRDLAARYGGEEFALILPSTDINGAVALAEIVRKAVQGKELLKRSTNEKLGRVTASFGVASAAKGDTVSSLIERADRCLYAAKRAGRNRVVHQGQVQENGTTAAA